MLTRAVEVAGDEVADSLMSWPWEKMTAGLPSSTRQREGLEGSLLYPDTQEQEKEPGLL